MDMSKVKVGMKFSTFTKLVKSLGEIPSKGGTNVEIQKKEILRYLNFEKTGKISRGKPTNEIIITEIYDKPKPKIDNRVNNGRDLCTGEFSKPISELISLIRGNQEMTLSELMNKIGMIKDKSQIDTFNEYDKNLKTYKHQFKKDFKRKLMGAANSLNKKFNGEFEMSNSYLLKIGEYDKREDMILAEKSEAETINNLKEKLKLKFCDKYEKAWSSIQFNSEIFEEFCLELESQVCFELNVFGYMPCLVIENYIEDMEYNMECAINYSDNVDSLKESYENFMEKIIENYNYKLKNNSSGFGLGRASSIDGIEIYPLRNDLNVKKFHEELFEKVNRFEEIKN